MVGCEWRQEVRQQLLCAEPVDYAGWTGLRPAVVLFEVAPRPAAFGCDVDYAISVLHGFSSSRVTDSRQAEPPIVNRNSSSVPIIKERW